jgi:hypothetical protein
MSEMGVRRDKAALSSGCKPHPATAPAGSNGAVMEVTKWLKPPDKRVTKYGDSASVQAVTRVNAEQASKRTMRGPTRQPLRGRLTRLRSMSEEQLQSLRRGSGEGMYTRTAHATREAR